MFLGRSFLKIVHRIWFHQKLVTIATKWNFLSNSWAPMNGTFLHHMDMKKFLKNLLHWSDFRPFLRNCLRNFDLLKNMALVNGGFLHYTWHEEIPKKSSFLKLLVRFWNNFTGIFLGRPFSKIVGKILIRPLTWLWWMGASCSIWTWRNS